MSNISSLIASEDNIKINPSLFISNEHLFTVAYSDISPPVNGTTTSYDYLQVNKDDGKNSSTAIIRRETIENQEFFIICNNGIETKSRIANRYGSEIVLINDNIYIRPHLIYKVDYTPENLTQNNVDLITTDLTLKQIEHLKGRRLHGQSEGTALIIDNQANIHNITGFAGKDSQRNIINIDEISKKKYTLRNFFFGMSIFATVLISIICLYKTYAR